MRSKGDLLLLLMAFSREGKDVERLGSKAGALDNVSDVFNQAGLVQSAPDLPEVGAGLFLCVLALLLWTEPGKQWIPLSCYAVGDKAPYRP